MKTWTDAAKECLDKYLAERAAKAGLLGDEATEVMEDWRLHVHEEVEREAAPVVSVEGLEPVLARLGKVDHVDQPSGAGGGASESGKAPQEDLRRWQAPMLRAGLGFMWFFGVILPVGIVCFEWMTSFCASVFFDPLRTWVHLVVVSVVPAVNAWLLLEIRRGGLRNRGWAAAAMGLAMVVALFYAWLFVPLLPASSVPSFFFFLFRLLLLFLLLLWKHMSWAW